MPEIAADDGPSFTLLRVEAETGFLRTPPMTYEGPEMKYRFGRALEKKLRHHGVRAAGLLRPNCRRRLPPSCCQAAKAVTASRCAAA